jgi:uncharacterized membrane protein
MKVEGLLERLIIMNVQIIASILAATFAGMSALIGLGFCFGGLRAREVSYVGPAAVMFGAAFNYGYRYTTPIGWLVAVEILVVSAFLLMLRQWHHKLEPEA